MAGLLKLFTLALFAVLSAGAAQACEFLVAGKGGDRTPARFATIDEGIVSGALRCGREVHPAYIWTLRVDGDQKSLGIRDDKLHDTAILGPLGELMTADIEDHARLTILERSETIAMSRSPLPRGWFRLQRFFTFCESAEGVDPLDCSVGEARIKGRRTDEDTDRDGFLDISRHEISFYDGSSKLHFMSFVTPWARSTKADAGLWIEAVNAVSDVLLPREVALAD